MALQIKPKNLDRYRWVALFMGMVVISTCALGYTWSLLVEPMIELRGATDEGMATVYTGLTATAAIFTIIGGKLIDKIGSAKVIFSGIIAMLVGMLMCGMSESFAAFAFAQVIVIAWQQAVIYIACMNTAEQLFPDYRGVAVSLTATGLAIGGMWIAPFTQGLIDSMGFSQMFIVEGIVLAVIGCIALFFFPDCPKDYRPAGIKEVEEDVTQGGRVRLNPDFVQKDWKMMLKDPAFYLLFFIPLFASSGYMLLSYQLAYIAEEILTIDAMTAAFLVSGISLMGIVCLVVSPIADRFGRMKIIVVLLFFGALSMAGLVFSESHGIVWFAVCSFVYCFCLGAFAGIHPAVIGDYFGSEHFSFNYSLNYMSILLAAAVSPWLAVFGGDTGSYANTFMVCAVLCGIAFILAIIILKYKGNNIEYIRVEK